ncbi:MAG: hypothetical protein JSV55_06605, partial [Deltaproteobacteria bacterium]
FKPTHRPISLSTKVAACVRRFETATSLNHGWTESKKDISMLGSLGSVTNTHWTSANGKERHFFKGVTCYMILCLLVRLDALYFRFLQRLTEYTLTRIDALRRKV